MKSKKPKPQCQHTPNQPEGYLAWNAWAEKMSKSHRQVKCPGCGLWALWVPKKERAPRKAAGEPPATDTGTAATRAK